jgi:para-nitrobenzyl esterase
MIHRFWLIWFCLVFITASSASAQNKLVRIDSGQLSGVALDIDVRAFKGIPFAAPPVGPMR